VIVVNFGSFKAAVNYIHGVYVDVDRRYFNDHTGPGGYAAIDIQPGYQKLVGQDALDYVRYRHTDNDIVRAARQQDFLRQARNSAGVKRLFSLGDRDKLARTFARYFQFDQGFTHTKEIFSLLRLGAFLAQSHPAVKQIPFPFFYAPDPVADTRLYFNPAKLRKAVDQFMNFKPPARRSAPAAASKPAGKVKHSPKPGPVKGLIDARSTGEDQAVVAQPHLKFPVYFPTQLYQGSSYSSTGPRVYTIRDETGKRHRAYRLVLATGTIGEYYGIQGMTWKSPPILDNPDQIRVVGGRRLLIYTDRSHVRLVAWRTRRAVYWVTNTLTETLNRAQMLGIAASMRRLKG
jgi:hypothetical protein